MKLYLLTSSSAEMALLPGPEAEEDAELIPARRVAVSEILPLTMVGNQVPTAAGSGNILIMNKIL